MRIPHMIGTAANHLTLPASSALASRTTQVRRRISPQAGMALEKLGHAIEYLTDEFTHQEGAPAFRRDGRIEAIQLLMSLNRQIYYECPEVPTLRGRLSAFLHQLL